MKRILREIITSICLIMILVVGLEAQEVVPLYEGTAPGSDKTAIMEKITYSQDSSIIGISDVIEPSISVYLSDPDVATGSAAVVLPGGALRFLSWENEGVKVAAGCLALFIAWKKAGGKAEIHVYGKGKGAFGMTRQGLPSDTWIESFHTWLLSEGF